MKKKYKTKSLCIESPKMFINLYEKGQILVIYGKKSNCSDLIKTFPTFFYF